jgi:hypothetical protein
MIARIKLHRGCAAGVGWTRTFVGSAPYPVFRSVLNKISPLNISDCSVCVVASVRHFVEGKIGEAGETGGMWVGVELVVADSGVTFVTPWLAPFARSTTTASAHSQTAGSQSLCRTIAEGEKTSMVRRKMYLQSLKSLNPGDARGLVGVIVH